MDEKKLKIIDYYQSIKLPEECFNKKSIKNLLELSAVNNINLFDDKKKNLKIKSKRKIIKECGEKKKENIDNLVNQLSNFNLKNDIISSNEVKNINDNTINNLKSIDSIIKIVNSKDSEIETLKHIITEENNDDSFIERFSN